MLQRRIRDARHILRRVPAPAWDHGTPTERPTDRVVNQIRAAIYGVPAGLGRRLTGGAICGLGIGLATWFAVRNTMGPVDSVCTAPFMALLLGAAAAWGYFRLGVAPPRYEAASQLIAMHRVCVCCGYNLAGLTPGPDGCTTCPECAAAWRVLPPASTPTQ